MIPPDVRLAPQPALIARELSRKIAVRPKDPLLYTCRGVTYAKLGEPAKAIHDVSRAITLDPCSATAYDFRGSQYAVQRDFTKAMEDFNRALEIDPRQVEYTTIAVSCMSCRVNPPRRWRTSAGPLTWTPTPSTHTSTAAPSIGNRAIGSCAADDARRLMLRLPAEPVGYYSLAAARSAHRATLRESTASGRSRLPRSRPRLATWPGSWRLIPTPLAETEPRPPVVPSWHWRSGLKRRRPRRPSARRGSWTFSPRPMPRPAASLRPLILHNKRSNGPSPMETSLWPTRSAAGCNSTKPASRIACHRRLEAAGRRGRDPICRVC